MFTETRKKQLAARIRARREELGLRQDAIQDHGGPSPETVNQYEQGNLPENPQNRTLHGYDRALRWQKGSIKQFLLTGQEPVPLEAPEDRLLASIPTVPPGTSGGAAHAPPGMITIPRQALNDLLRATSKMSLIARVTEVGDDALRKSIGEVQRAAADLNTVLVGMESRDPDVLAVIAKITSS